MHPTTTTHPPDKRHTLYCSFCGKSQHEVRHLIAGPTIFICNECLDYSVDLISEKVNRLSKSIHFEPEHRQAGLGILNYFARYLTERYPDVETKITIEQDGGLVRLVIEALDGKVDVVEQTLEEYALIIMGKAQPEDFLRDQYQILELRQKLELAAAEIRWQERYIGVLESDRRNHTNFFAQQMEHMHHSLAIGISNSARLADALTKLAERPTIDPLLIEGIDKIANSLRTGHQINEATAKESLAEISQKNPGLLREIYELCMNTVHGAAGHVLAMWIAPLIGILPKA